MVVTFAFMCCVRTSEQTASFTLYNKTYWLCVTDVEGVYCAVRAESLYKTDTFRLKRVNPFSTAYVIYVFLLETSLPSYISRPA